MFHPEWSGHPLQLPKYAVTKNKNKCFLLKQIEYHDDLTSRKALPIKIN
jgi:hypothetical protein